MNPVFVRLFFQQLTCNVMFLPFEKLLLNVRVFLCKGIFDAPRNNVAVLS